jgi:H2-forming N5,N10-methylenetetrahydromethanopterin dehydrogenase-like enzyme
MTLSLRYCRNTNWVCPAKIISQVCLCGQLVTEHTLTASVDHCTVQSQLLGGLLCVLEDAGYRVTAQ